MCGSDGLSSSSSLLICGKSCRCQAENPLNALPSFTRPALCSILKLKRWATANGHRQEPTHSRHSADLAKSPRPGWVVTPKYTEHADENLRVMDFARRRIDDPDPLAR